MRKQADMLKIDRTVINVTSIKESDEKKYWQTRLPEERLEALELLRQIAYGYKPNSIRLQRVFEIVEQK